MANEIQGYIEKLKQNNIRMTSQRIAILEFLATDGNHPTANEIYQALKDKNPNMSIATVYNNLLFFKKAGILKEIPFGEGSNRYDLTDTKHYHAVCENCGKVVDFDYQELEKINTIVENQINFKVLDHNFKVTGLCENCK